MPRNKNRDQDILDSINPSISVPPNLIGTKYTPYLFSPAIADIENNFTRPHSDAREELLRNTAHGSARMDALIGRAIETLVFSAIGTYLGIVIGFILSIPPAYFASMGAAILKGKGYEDYNSDLGFDVALAGGATIGALVAPVATLIYFLGKNSDFNDSASAFTRSDAPRTNAQIEAIAVMFIAGITVLSFPVLCSVIGAYDPLGFRSVLAGDEHMSPEQHAFATLIGEGIVLLPIVAATGCICIKGCQSSP